MSGIFPVCYTTRGGYIYAAAFDLREGRNQARIVVAQSKRYPTSTDEFDWQAIGEAPIARDAYSSHTYNCAWNVETSTFALKGMDLSNIDNHRSRFGIALATVYTRGMEGPPTKGRPLSFSRFNTDPYRHNETIVPGKSVIVAVEGAGAVPWATGGDWVHIQLNGTSNELLLRTYRNAMPYPDVPLIAWRMNNYGPIGEGSGVPKNGTRNYRLVAHSNDKLFVIGFKDTTGGLVVTTLPLSPQTLTKKPISILQPALYDATTIESDQEVDCNFDHNRTTASVYNNQLLVLCYPKNRENSSLQLFTFNGKVFEKIGSYIEPFQKVGSFIEPKSTINHGPKLVPIPAQAPITAENPNPVESPSPWAYLSSSFGQEGYKVDLLGLSTPGGLGGIITIDNKYSKPFTLDFSKYLSDDIYNSPRESEHRGVPLIIWLLGLVGLGMIILVVAILVYKRRVRQKEARRREAIENGMDPDMNPDTVGGVTRTAFGDDASDALPMYTLRAPPLSYIAQPTDPVSGSTSETTATTAAAATQTTTATTATTATQTTGHIIMQGPIPTDSPPSYSPDPTRPIIGLEDTQSDCIDDNDRSNGSSEVQPATTIDIPTAADTTTDTPPSSTESATIQRLEISTADPDSTVAAAAPNIGESTGHATASTQANIVEKETVHSTTAQRLPTTELTQAPSSTTPTVNGDTKTDI
ncbi:hypothetical protein BGX24_011623 [Mortierella sp. AD032]|nr:hypothetical protein BGX24_011623 [Mortierella sp. AD032]